MVRINQMMENSADSEQWEKSQEGHDSRFLLAYPNPIRNRSIWEATGLASVGSVAAAIPLTPFDFVDHYRGPGLLGSFPRDQAVLASSESTRSRRIKPKRELTAGTCRRTVCSSLGTQLRNQL